MHTALSSYTPQQRRSVRYMQIALLCMSGPLWNGEHWWGGAHLCQLCMDGVHLGQLSILALQGHGVLGCLFILALLLVMQS